MAEQNLVQIESNRSFISRSAILAFKACEYKGYLTYFYDDHGITSSQAVLDLLIGTVVHRGLQHLLEHCRIHHPDGKFDNQCIDEAVAKAKEVWTETLSNYELALHSGEFDRLDEIIPEQECLFEGLIRGFAIKKLPGILEEYEILEVEKEEVFEDFSDLVTFLAKADGLFLRKSDNKLVILSIKTASQYLDVTERDILHDMQGVSEWVCVKDRIVKNWKKYKEIKNNQTHYIELEDELPSGELELIENYHWFEKFNSCPEIYAVQYEYLIKGQRKQDPYGSGIYKQNSFLVHSYKMESLMTLSGGNFSTSSDDYKWKSKGSGRLPKGWSKIDIWNDVGIKNWIEMLATGKIQSEEGDPFEEILITPPLVLRLPEELEEWLVSTRFYAERLHRGLEWIRGLENKIKAIDNSDLSIATIDKLSDLGKFRQQLKMAIWEEFPKNTKSCHSFYGRDCQFVPHCHELLTLDESVNSSLYKTRLPHHELELNNFIEKGYLEGK